VCPEAGCRNTCLGRRCRDCHFRGQSSSSTQPASYASDEGGFHENK
jgi:hypothetical protein